MRNHLASCTWCLGQRPAVSAFQKNGFAVLRCPDCGLGRVHAPDFDPEAYYTGAYFDGGHQDGYANYKDSENVLKAEFQRTLQALERMGKTQGRLLEIGCAYGFFLDIAKTRFDVQGIEIANDAVLACHERGLTEVISGKASPALLDTIAPVDVIVMLDVIEHLEHPDQVLSDALQRLKPGGLFMLTTGDWSSLLAKASGPGWRLMTPPQHLWYFTPKSITAFARRLGLEVVEVSHPWKLVPLSLILFQLKRMFGLGSKPVTIDWLHHIGLPVNLFDAMRITLHKPLHG